MRCIKFLILVLIITLIQGIFLSCTFGQEATEKYTKNSIDDICVTIDTTKKPMTIYQIVTELRRQIGDINKNKLLVARCVKESTLEIQICINNKKIGEALVEITKKYNVNKVKCPYPFNPDELYKYKYLVLCNEGSRYVLNY